jgi:BTB/POZ domain
MSTSPLELASNTLTSAEPLADTHFASEPSFEYPGADLVLYSRDSHHFLVPKSYIANSSPVLDKLIRRTQYSLDDASGKSPLVELPESGEILHSLFTFVFPVTPLLPSSTEQTMELLSVAQKYQMVSVLAHIRGSIARQDPPADERDAALHIYSLAQKYGLRPEALQAARTILKYPMSIYDLEDKLDIMPGTSFYGLWEYYEEVRAKLASNITEFTTSSARVTLTGLKCVKFAHSQIPCWIDDYIESIGKAPHLFDLIGFNTALARHLGNKPLQHKCTCSSIPNQNIRNFWRDLASVVDASFQEVNITHIYLVLTRFKSLQAESALSLVQNREDIQSQVDSTTSLPEPLDVSDADLIIRSSNLVNFRVHQTVLAMASPFFKDLLSLPQPSDSESVDGLPVVQLAEDAELLHSLVSLLYPVPSVIPDSHEKVLYLLAACQQYDMVEAQSYIRAEINRSAPLGSLPPFGDTVFRVYAIAREKGLIPEMERAAHLTLDQPMTFETLGEGLQLFQGSALRDLARFRKRCRDNLVTCLKSFLQPDAPGPSSIWVGCPSASNPKGDKPLPIWLYHALSYKDLKSQEFTHPLPTSSSISERYLTAINTHDELDDCDFCVRVHAKHGIKFVSRLERKLEHAREKVHTSFL